MFKDISAFGVNEILNFSKEGRFRSKFHEIQVLSQIVLYNRR